MKLLIICPGKIAKDKSEIKCFSDLLNYYLPKSICKFINADIENISMAYSSEVITELKRINFAGYDAVLFLGLRFFSHQPSRTIEYVRSRFNGLICQIHDGSRRNTDGVDITFTFKNDDRIYKNTKDWHNHKNFNWYIGWAADPELNRPEQNPDTLGILIDHTNYGKNPIDDTVHIINQVKRLINSRIWESKFKNISVRRFDSGKTVNVDFNNTKEIQRFDRSKSIPITEISKEHGKAHIFMVTHPESVGLVVLETSLAGALTVTPNTYINPDRLETVRHYKYPSNTDIDWNKVLSMIDVTASKNTALKNNWDTVAKRLIEGLKNKLRNNER